MFDLFVPREKTAGMEEPTWQKIFADTKKTCNNNEGSGEIQMYIYIYKFNTLSAPHWKPVKPFFSSPRIDQKRSEWCNK